MGGLVSRRAGTPPANDVRSSQTYRYPPKTGCYFGSTFIMGGKKFDSTQPDAFLFGDNSDLNFLSERPCLFPFSTNDMKEPSRTLCSLVNIRKDSLRFVKALDAMAERDKDSREEVLDPSTITPKYNIEFTFDTDANIAITIYYFAKEEIVGNDVKYIPRDAKMNSDTYHYQKGANQTFVQTSHVVDPTQVNEEEWQFSPDKEYYPIVIQCVVQDQDFLGHSHATLAAIDKFSDQSYGLKPLKQKQMVEGMYFLLQEIYGIENKNHERAKLDDDYDDYGLECVICMCDVRDTLILPCRHLCLCHSCADDLRFQASNCPICRAPFRALLQINALKKLDNRIKREGSSLSSISQGGVPAGYEAVSLIDALNGPCEGLTDTSTRSSKKKSKKSSSARSSRRSRRSVGDHSADPGAETSSTRGSLNLRGPRDKGTGSPGQSPTGAGGDPGVAVAAGGDPGVAVAAGGNPGVTTAIQTDDVTPHRALAGAGAEAMMEGDNGGSLDHKVLQGSPDHDPPPSSWSKRTSPPPPTSPPRDIPAINPPNPPTSLPVTPAQKIKVRDAATCTSGDSPSTSFCVSLPMDEGEYPGSTGPEDPGSTDHEYPESTDRDYPGSRRVDSIVVDIPDTNTSSASSYGSACSQQDLLQSRESVCGAGEGDKLNQ